MGSEPPVETMMYTTEKMTNITNLHRLRKYAREPELARDESCFKIEMFPNWLMGILVVVGCGV